MEASENGSVCGICGRPLGERHAHEAQKAAADKPGKRVEYVIVGKRGGIADYQAVGNNSKTYKGDSTVLAMQLGIEESNLVGSRFSCWVSPAEYGVIRSDFKLIS